MATTQDLYNLLNQIENNTRNAGGKSAPKMSEDSSNRTDGDKFSESLKPFGKSIANLIKAHEEYVKSLSSMEKVNEGFDDLISNVRESVESGKDHNQVIKENEKVIKKLSSAGINVRDILGNTSINLEDMSKELINAKSKFKDELFESQTKSEKEFNKFRQESFKAFLGNLGTGLKATVAGAATTLYGPQGLGSGIIEAFQQAGFQFGGEGDQLGGAIGTMQQAARLGVGTEEALRFAAQERNIIAAMSRDAMISAEKGLEVTESYGQDLIETFGSKNQLERMSKMFNTMTNLGVEITDAADTGFDRMRQNVKNIQRLSELDPDEILSNFKELSEDKTLQMLAISYKGQIDIVNTLAESFLTVQESANLTAEEFQKLNQRIAQQQQQDVVSRVVQARVRGRMAGQFGMSDERVDVLRRGTRSRALLKGPEELELFTESVALLEQNLTRRLAEARATGAGGVQLEKQLEVLSKLGNVEELSGPIAREIAKVTPGEFQADRLVEATDENTSGLMQTVSSIKELVAGIMKSPLGAGAGFFAGMIGSVATGTYQGYMMASGKGLLFKGLEFLTGGKWTKLIPGGSRLLNTLKVLTKLALPITAVIAAFEGLTKAIEYEGNIWEKLAIGFREATDSILGIPGYIAQWVADLFGIDIDASLWKRPLAAIWPDEKEVERRKNKAIEAAAKATDQQMKKNKEAERRHQDSIYLDYIKQTRPGIKNLDEKIKSLQDTELKGREQLVRELKENQEKIEKAKDEKDEEALAELKEQNKTLKKFLEKMDEPLPEEPVLGPSKPRTNNYNFGGVF